MVKLLQVTKILATGCNKRFMWVKHCDFEMCIKINNDTYKYLKQIGVPTSQSLRKHKTNK